MSQSTTKSRAPKKSEQSIALSWWLADLGLASRSEAKSWILEGRIKVAGKVVSDPAVRIVPGKNHVTIDGKPVKPVVPPRVYWLLHKPGKISCTGGAGDVETIADLPRIRKIPFRVWPWPALDFLAEGTVLLTNDDSLLHAISGQKVRPLRQYQVLLSKKLTKEEHDRLMAGIKMRDGFAEISKLQYLQKRDLGASTGAWYTVHTLDGRRKFLSRFFEHVDATVVRQILLAIGPLRLPPDLKAGHYIQLDAKQIKDMRKLIDGKSQS